MSERRVVDVGLQPERTYLAWTRTGLAFAAVAALLIRRASAGHAWLMVFGLPAAIATAFVLLRAQWRYRRTVARVQQGLSPYEPRLVAAVAVAACLVSIGGLVAVLTS